nr:hypothetical protein CFP56_67747 [Quercus suber]
MLPFLGEPAPRDVEERAPANLPAAAAAAAVVGLVYENSCRLKQRDTGDQSVRGHGTRHMSEYKDGGRVAHYMESNVRPIPAVCAESHVGRSDIVIARINA